MTFHPAERHEDPAVDTRRVLLFVGVFLGFTILLVAALLFYYHAITAKEVLTVAVKTYPIPQLQPNPTKDYEDFEAEQTRQLEGYAWADASHTRVHVPIDRAMAIVAARGAQAYEPVQGTPPFPATGQPPLDGAPRASPQLTAAPYGVSRP